MTFSKRKLLPKKDSTRPVDAYISAAPKKYQRRLRQFRAILRETSSSATEGFSYGMPFYDYKGRLAWFGLGKSYIGLYLRPPVIEEHRKELADYKTTKSAIHFPLDEKVPVSLIKRLVRDRMRKNEAEHKRGPHERYS